jgi:hypothetical protein
MAFYLVATKWEHLWVAVPFCEKCADRRKRWEKLDIVLLLTAVITSFAFSALLAGRLNLEPWAFWVIFLGVAAILTALCNRLVRDFRAVRIKGHDENTIAFAFNRPEYAIEFARLNGQTASQ